MKKITFPLKPEMKGPEVEDLQAALELGTGVRPQFLILLKKSFSKN